MLFPGRREIGARRERELVCCDLRRPASVGLKLRTDLFRQFNTRQPVNGRSGLVDPRPTARRTASS